MLFNARARIAVVSSTFLFEKTLGPSSSSSQSTSSAACSELKRRGKLASPARLLCVCLSALTLASSRQLQWFSGVRTSLTSCKLFCLCKLIRLLMPTSFHVASVKQISFKSSEATRTGWMDDQTANKTCHCFSSLICYYLFRFCRRPLFLNCCPLFHILYSIA